MDSFNDTIEKIKEKIGEENSALVSDELLSLMTEHKSTSDTLNERDEEIVTLKTEKENLVSANSKLFQRIGFENNLGTNNFTQPNQTDQKVETELDLGDIINDKGDFI